MPSAKKKEKRSASQQQQQQGGSSSSPGATAASSSHPIASPDPPPFNMFNSFQKHRGDFESSWLMMEDDPLPDAPPMAEEVKEKLRAQQASFQQARKDDEEDSESGVLSSELNSDEEYSPSSTAVSHPQQQSASDSLPPSRGFQADSIPFLQTEQIDEREVQSRVYTPNHANHRREEDGEGDGAAALSVPLWSAERYTKAGGYLNAHPTIALHQEIMDLTAFLRPTQADVSVRRYVEMEVTTLAKRLWPACEVVVYGSLITHLLLPRSDVDMTIRNIDIPVEDALMRLAEEVEGAHLEESGSLQVILKTKVPLIKFNHVGSLIGVDISIEAMDGKENTMVVVGLLDEFPEARPLIILLKYFLQQRDMDEPYKGGLGSYAVTLLVISFLQHHPIYTTEPEQRRCAGLGTLLVDFFRYAGYYWQYVRCGVSVRRGGRYFYRDSQRAVSPVSPNARGGGPGGPTLVELEDPGNPDNNAASSLRLYHAISSFFTQAYCALTASFPPPGPAASPSSTDLMMRPTLLSRVLHVDPQTVRQQRRTAAAYQHLCETMPERMAIVRAYRRDDDRPMLEGRWKEKRSAASSQSTSASSGSQRLREVPAASFGSSASSLSPASSASSSQRRTPLERLRAMAALSKEEEVKSVERLTDHQRRQLLREAAGREGGSGEETRRRKDRRTE